MGDKAKAFIELKLIEILSDMHNDINDMHGLQQRFISLNQKLEEGQSGLQEKLETAKELMEVLGINMDGRIELINRDFHPGYCCDFASIHEIEQIVNKQWTNLKS